MRDSDIKKCIELLNSKNTDNSIFLRSISDNVELAKVWEKEPQINDDIHFANPSYNFFFIKDQNGKLVGAVLDMIRDLHWFILEEERKKGYLTTALKETILPYLFYDENNERNIQRITVKRSIGERNYNNSKSVALKLGFKAINEDKTIFELKHEEFDWQYENIKEINSKISDDRLSNMQKLIIYSFRKLTKISDELFMAYGDDEDLYEIAGQVRDFYHKLEDYKWRKI